MKNIKELKFKSSIKITMN